jgi:hypothetical protein
LSNVLKFSNAFKNAVFIIGAFSSMSQNTMSRKNTQN